MPPRTISVARSLAAGALAAAAGPLWACGGAAPPPPAPVPAASHAECVLPSTGGAALDSLVAAASGADTALLTLARARTPIGLSCTGRPLPRVAAAWNPDSTRTHWTLVVPAAAELARHWRDDRNAAAALRLAGVTSVVPLDDRRLVVGFAAAVDSVPAVFADPALAAPGDADAPSAIRLLAPAGGDLRDALDRGATVVTSDPAVIGYADRRPGITPHPLPWNRTYVLLAPRGGSTPLVLAAGDSAEMRGALARDAVRVAARAAAPPYWWDSTDCARAPAPGGSAAATVAYPADDPVARALAERILAMSNTPNLVASGVADAELSAAITRGEYAAVVVPLPKRALVPCREIAAWPVGAAALPLIETRPTALLPPGAPPLQVDYDGGLLVGEQR